MKPSGVWATRPIRPPGRVTRASSLAVRSWSGANIAPNTELTTSKLLVVERQRLRVALEEVGVQALGLGAPARPLEQGRDVVEADDRAAAPRRGQGGVAAAGRDVEDALGRVDVERLDEQLRHDQDLGPDHVVVAARPGRLLALLDRREVRRRRDGGHLISFVSS